MFTQVGVVPVIASSAVIGEELNKPTSQTPPDSHHVHLVGGASSLKDLVEDK